MIDQDIKDKMHDAFVAMSNGDTEFAIATVAELAGEALTHMRRQTVALEKLVMHAEARSQPPEPPSGVT